MSESMKNKKPIVLISVLLEQQDAFTEETSSAMIVRSAPCTSVSVLSQYSDADIGITISNEGMIAIGETSGEEKPAVVRLLDLVRWARSQNIMIDRGSERVH